MDEPTSEIKITGSGKVREHHIRDRLTYLGYFGVAGCRHVLKMTSQINTDNIHVLDKDHANKYIFEKLNSGEPFMAGRLGSGEMLAFLKTIEVRLGLRRDIPAGNMDSLCINAGFFPRTQEAVMRFGDCMEEACGEADLLGIWGTIPMEPYLIKTRFRDATLCKLSGLEPFFTDIPWSRALAGRKVLVIHPFEKTIRKQYEKREKLFSLPDTLPEFELMTLKAVQTIAGETDERFSDWFEALDYMTDEALKLPFDVAVIGCGAYGFPLAARLKHAGRQVIHLGGSTQLLFGIRGQRWDQREDFQGLFNEFWCRPSADEKPAGAQKIENNCYW